MRPIFFDTLLLIFKVDNPPWVRKEINEIMNNSVKLQGVLLGHHSTKNGAMLLTLNATGWVSANRPISDEEKAKMDYPSIIVTKPELVTQVQEMLAKKQHPHITVEGKLQRANQYGNRRATVITKATSITLTESTMMERFGLETSTSEKQYANEVTLLGELTGISVNTNRNIAELTIHTTDGKDKATVTCTVFGRNGYIKKNLSIGNRIAAIGAIRTRTRLDHNGERLYFENCVLTDIMSIDEKEKADATESTESVPSTVIIP